MTSEPWNDPSQHETVPCPLCERAPDDAIVVGTRARFDMAVRNVACRSCGLVRVSPRPTPEAMDAYYRGPYRAQYRTVKLPLPGGGGFVGPDDPGYAEARAARYRSQAQLALRLGDLQPGQRVLEVGCRDGQTLMQMVALGGVEAFGVEPGPEEAAEARERGVDVFVGLLEEFAPAPDARFDQVQMFHVLEHLHEPLAALTRLASWLKPGGTLLIEVPNVTQPYGALEGNFFQNAHLTSFSANTLAAMFERAGLEPQKMADGGTLFMTGTPSGGPRAFAPEMLPDRAQDGAWVAERLDTYRHVQRLKEEILGGKISMDRLGVLTQMLRRPGFAVHSAESVHVLLDVFARAGAPRAALALATAVIEGPHEAALQQQCQRLVELCRRQLGGSEGTVRT